MRRITRMMAAAAVLFASGLLAQAQAGPSYTFTNATDANWFNPTNWSPNGVPASGGTAIITNFTVKVSNLASVSRLNLSGGNLAAPKGLAVTLAGNWTGGALSGFVTVNEGAVFYLNNTNAGGTLDLPGTALSILGTVVWESGTIQGDGSTVITNSGSWVVNGVNNQFNNAYGGAPVFINNRSFLMTNAAGDTLTFSGVAFTNNNNSPFGVEVQSGTLFLQGGGYLNGGFYAAAGATIRFDQVDGVSALFTTGPNFLCSGPGTSELTGGEMLLGNDQAGLALTGGTVTLGPSFQNGGAVTNLTLAGSALDGTNTLTGTMNWLAGDLYGVLTISSSGALNLSGAGAVYQYAALTNLGHIYWNGSGDWYLCNDGGGYYSGQINNLSGGVIDAQCNNQLLSYYYGSGWFVNSGLFRKTMSTNTTIIGVAFTNTAGGTVTVQSGELEFNYLGSFGGAFQAANGTRLVFYQGGLLSGAFTAGYGADIGFDGGTFTEAPSASFGGAGTVELNGGTLTLETNQNPSLQLNGGTVNLPSGFQGGNITNLTVSGITLNGTNTVTGVLNLNGNLSGPLTVAPGGVVNWSGGYIYGSVSIAQGGALNITGTSYKEFAGGTNAGTVNWSGGNVELLYRDTFYNLASATFNIECDNYLTYYNGTESFNNAGLVQKYGTTGQTGIYVNFTNTGVVLAQSGTLVFEGEYYYYGQNSVLGGTFQAGSGATLDFYAGGILTGDFTSAAGGHINLESGTFTPTPTLQFNGPGSNTMTGGVIILTNTLVTNLQLTGGSVLLTPAFQGGTITNLTLNGASLEGTNTVTGVLNLYGAVEGPLTVASNATLNLGGGIAAALTLLPGSTMNWSNGYDYSFPLTVPSNAVMNLTGPGYIDLYNPLTNAGTVNFNGGDLYLYYYNYYAVNYNEDNGVICNLPGATFNVRSNAYGYGNGIFNNAGLFVRSSMPTNNYIDWIFNNTGVVDVQTGTLNIAGPVQASNASGTYKVEASATLNLSGGGYLTGEFTAAGGGTMDFSGGIFTNTTSTVLDGTGAYNLDGGTFNLLYDLPANLNLISGYVNPGPNYIGSSLGTLTLNGVGLAGTNTVTGTLSLSGNVDGPLTVAGGATLTLSGNILAPVVVQSGGTFNWIGANPIQYPVASVTVQAGGVWNIAPTNYAAIEAPVTNAGTVNWTGGYLQLRCYYYNLLSDGGGVIYNLAGGSFNILTDQPIEDYYGYEFINNLGTLRKSGTTGTTVIQVLCTNTGTIDVESGTIEFGNTFSQSGGTWDFGGASGGGLLSFEYQATLPGTLNVTASPGYVPGVTNFINIADYPSYSGSISNVNLPGASWQLNYGSTALSLIVTNQPLPGITLTNPPNGAGFTAPASIAISAVPYSYAITDFGGNGAGWTVNQSPYSSEGPSISGNVLHLTHGNYYEGGSVFYDIPQNITSFTATFTWHNSTPYTGSETPYDGYDPADGFAFVVQNQGVSAVGGYGGNLGFGGISPGGCVAFNMVSAYGIGTKFASSTSNYVFGGYQSVSPVNLEGTDPLNVTLSYNGSTLTEILIDTVTGAAFTNNYSVNFPVGGSTAYVGFSAGTGTGTSVQDISNFSFTSLSQNNDPLASVQFYQGTTLLGSGEQEGQSYEFTWNSAPAGNYALTAVATDTRGNAATSAPVNITVYKAGLQPTNYTWTGAVSTDWFNPANWSPNGVPGGRDSVMVANGGAVVVGQSAGVTNLTLMSGTIGGAGALTVSNRFVWTGGKVTNTLVISSNATLQINSTGSVGLSNATLVNRGTVEWIGGAIVGSPGTLITNGSGALWLLETDSYLQLNAPVSLTNGLFVNNGTVRKTTTSGTTYFESGNFINKGLVDAESGVISFYSGGVLSGGYNAAPGASIEFGGGAFTLGAFPAITGTGTVALTGGTLTLVTNAPPQLLLEGGSVTLGTNFQNAGAITNLTLSGATLPGTNTVTGTFNFFSGTVGGGVLTVAPTGLLILGESNYDNYALFYDLSLVNNGEVVWRGGSVSCSGSTITNNNLWLMQGGSEMYSGTFVNNGLIKQTTAGYSYIENTVFINKGTVDAEAGTIDLYSGGAFGGAYNTASGAVIAFGGGTNSLTGLPNFSGLGSFQFSGGTLVLSNDIAPALQLTGGTVVLGPAFQNGGKINNLTLNGATLGGTNIVTGSLTFMGGAITGPLTVSSNATLNFGSGDFYFEGGGAITNFGTVYCSSTNVAASYYNYAYFYPEISNAVIVNNGLWLDQGNSAFENEYAYYANGGYHYYYGTFVNNGIYRKEGASGESYFEGWSFLNNGLVDVETGYFYLEDGGVLSGTYNTAAQAYLYFAGGNFATGAPAPNFTGAGNAQYEGTITLTDDVIPSLGLNSGTTIIIGTNFQRNGAITNLTLNGATLSGSNYVSGSLTLNNGSQISGSLTVLTNALLTISGGTGSTYLDTGATLINNGVVEWTGGVIYTYPSTVISNNGLWLVESDSYIYNEYYYDFSDNTNYYTNTVFFNAGTFAKATTTGTTPFYGIAFLNSGTLDVQSGALDFSAYNYDTNSFTYEQTGATLAFGVSAPSLAGRLVLSSNISLDGALEIDLQNGYAPAAGDEIQPISYGPGSKTAFANFVLPPLTNLTWDVETGAGGVKLRVVPPAVTNSSLQISGLVMDDNGHPISGVTVYATETGASNLIQNGSFETPLSSSSAGSTSIQYSPGSTNITGWTVVGPAGDSIALYINNYLGPAEDGTQYFDPTGLTGGAGISQTFPTVPGASYELVFYRGSYQHHGLNAVLGVTIGTNSYSFGETDGTYGNLDWRRAQIPFTASSNQTTLTFSDMTGFNADDNFVDNVQVIPPGFGTVAQAVTDANGRYQISVPTGTFVVGVDGLANAGYDDVADVTVLVNSDHPGTANFTPTPLSGGEFFSISTTVNPPALGSVSGGGSGFRLGAPETVSVTQNANALPYYFSGWTENGVLESTNPSYAFTVYRNRNLTANFSLPGLVVAASNNPPSDGLVAGTGVFAYNSTNVLTAIPYTGYKFINWTKTNGVVVSASNPLSTVVQTNLVLVANYGDANPRHLVTISNSPSGLTTGTGAGTYTNGQTAVISVPKALTNAGVFYVFQGFSLAGSPVTSSTSFSKSFSTFDPTNLVYVAYYQSNSMIPQIIGAQDNYANPVPATTGFQLTLQFDRSMRSSSTPLILLTNSATNAVQAAAGTNGLWSTTAISNDTYQTPGITFGNGMDGNVAVWVSRAQDIYGHVLSPATNVITLVVHSTPPPAPVVAITNPANGTLLTNNQSFAIRGTLSSTNFSGGVVEIYANGTALGAAALSGASSPYSFALNTSLTGGSYSLQAVATDASGLSTTSSVAHVTVETPGSVLIDFEALDASAAAVGGTKLSNYLAGFGVKATNVTPGTSLAAAGYNVFLGGTVAGPAPADGSNFLAQTGANGPVSYTLLFSQPYASVSWVRPGLPAGTTGASLPGWQAHIFDNKGNELGSAGENALGSYTNVPEARFTLLGRGALQTLATNIYSIRFDGNNQGVSSLSTLPLDNLLLSTAATNTTLKVTLATGTGATSFTAPAQVVLNATVSDSAGTVSQVSFYEGSNFISSAAPVGGVATVTLNNLAATNSLLTNYVFTAVASDSVGSAGGSSNLIVTVSPVTGLKVINFDALNTASGSVGGTNLSSYLAGYGVALSNVTVGTVMEAVSGGLVTGAGGAVASSPPNYFTQAGLNQPVSFTLVFQSPLAAFGFTRVELVAGTGGVSHPQWTATALDANGNPLGSAGESLIVSATNVPARSFVLTGLAGGGIASVRFDSDSQKTAAFSAALLDDWILNANTVTAPLSVTLTTSLPASGSSPAPATDLLTAGVTDRLGAGNPASTNYSVSFYAGPNLLGSVNYPTNSLTINNLLAGTYVLRAQVADASGVTAFSSPVTNVVAGTGGNSQVVNFDSLNAAKGPVTNAPLSNYLAGFGITVTNLSPGTALASVNQATINGGGAVAASSPSNIVTQTGSNGPVSYTLSFANLLSSFGFTRPELLASPFVSQPAWQATAYDGAGVALGSVGEGLIGSYTNVGAGVFTLSGPGIASVQIASQGSGLTTFNAMVADDFILTTNGPGTNFPPAIAITSPVSGLDVISPVTLTVAAAVADKAAVTSVVFYANGVPIATNTGSPYTAQWTNSGAGGYALTAVAQDKNGLSRTSPVVNVTVLPPAFSFAIVTEPAANTTAKVGSSVSFSVATSVTYPVTYQWYQATQNGSNALAGQTESTLILFPVTNGNAGSYTVVASSMNGTTNVTLTSTPAVLTVAQPPVITTQPQGAKVAIGSNVVLSVAATGDQPFTYQWLLNGTPIPGVTNSAYSINSAQPLNSGSYAVVVGNSNAFAQSAAAVVQVQSGITVPSTDVFTNRTRINPLLGPVMGNNQNAIGQPPNGVDGKPGGKTLWYTWQASFTGVISLTTLGSDFDTLLGVYTGNSENALTPIAADDDSGGFFTSLVTFNVTAGTNYQIAVDGFKGASGNVVLGMPSGTAYRVLNTNSASSVPVIVSNPPSQLVLLGAKATLSVIAKNAQTYQWFFQGAPVGVGGTNSSLVITNFQSGSVGLYDVLVANVAGSVESEQASLQIAVTNGPGAGGSAHDKFGDAVDLSSSNSVRVSVTREPSSGGGDSRGYSVSQVFSTVGATKESGEQEHDGQSGGASQWFVYTAPISGILDVNTAGSSFNTIVAIYTGPGTNFASLSAVGGGYVTNYLVQGQPNVVITNVVGGTRYFIAVDGYNGASGTVQLHIGVGVAPSLVSPPASQLVAPGSNATFNVTAVGSTNFGYQWRLNGVNLAKATNASLSVTNAQAANQGSYSVIVSNVVATVTSAVPATLTLQYAPAITAQPTNETVFLLKPAGFAVTAVGANFKTNLMRYQWFSSNNAVLALAGATNPALSFATAQYTNHGNYFVTITNSYGAATSQVVSLTVVDTNRPTVAFKTPVNNFSTNTSAVSLTGTASDPYLAVTNVQVAVNLGAFQTVSGTTNWAYWATNLVAGTNYIYARSFNQAGTNSLTNLLHVIYVAYSPLIVRTNLAGAGAVTSKSGATNGANLIIGTNYTILAAAGSNYVFTNWTSGTPAGALTNHAGGSNLTFQMYSNMVLQANFVTNPFLAAAGSYNGLFYPAGGVTEASSGFIAVTVSGSGAFSGKVLLDGQSNSFSGYSFDLTGAAVITNLARSGKTPLNLALKLDLYPADGQIGGTVNTNAASGWQSAISADLALFSGNTNLATNYAGKWTVLLPPAATAPAGSPAGCGYLLISNSLGGMSTIWGGALADGTPSLTGSAPIARNGFVPLYQSLYSGKGSLMGWIHFTNEPPQNVAADSWFSWIKPAKSGTLYPLGFASLITSGVLGSPYENTAGAPVLNLTNATLTLDDGNLAGGSLIFTNLNLAGNTVSNAARGTGHGETNYLAVTLYTNIGNVKVTFQATGAKTNTTGWGAVLQNSTNAQGAFPGTNQTGSFILR